MIFHVFIVILVQPYTQETRTVDPKTISLYASPAPYQHDHEAPTADTVFKPYKIHHAPTYYVRRVSIKVNIHGTLKQKEKSHNASSLSETKTS